ncbi:GNAT family N-acetyltransferase [Myxococcota bacterium]|nr:GNAT family N-acetyltransferase [Myxococcota bacterium]
MSNFFSAPWFSQAAAQVLLPGEEVRPGTVEVAGGRYDLLIRARGGVPHLPLVDFYEERVGPADGPIHRVAGLPAVSLSSRTVDGEPAARSEQHRAAPWIDWTAFSTWESFVQVTSDRQWRAFRQSDRKIRKIGREVGKVRFSLDTPDHDLLERCLAWKSRQLRRTGRLDRFGSARNRQLLHLLLAQGHLRLAVLAAGGQPLSAVLIHHAPDRMSCWVTAYDPAFAIYSPGVLLFEHLMKASWDAGHRVFDFLIGDEDYKYHYATHERLVGAVGRTGLQDWLGRQGRAALHRWGADPGARIAHRARTLTMRTLQDRLQRERITPLPGPEPDWIPTLHANSRVWPGARLADPADCQLISLLDHAKADTAPLRVVVDRLRHEVQRLRIGLPRRIERRRASHPEPIEPPEPLNLKAGDTVRVKDRAGIGRTLQDGKLQGLYYIPQVMDSYAGQTFVVQDAVDQFYDEASRRVVRPRRSVTLKGATCDGSQLLAPGGCDRGCPVFWHDGWLERVDAVGVPPAPPPRPDRKAPGRWQAGDRVRIASREHILATCAADPAGDQGIRYVPALMAAHFGTEAVVARRMAWAYDERLRRHFAVTGAVVLEGVSCPGAALHTGGRCQRGCALLWRDEWLLPA